MKALISYIGLSCILLWSCSDLLDVEPPNPGRDEALETTEDYLYLLNSCYEIAGSAFGGAAQNLVECLTNNLSSPNSNDDYTQVYNRRIDFFNGTNDEFFKEPYTGIFRCNSLIENATDVPGLTEQQSTQMVAEARFLRALNYFYLVQMYGQPWGYQNPEPAVGTGSNSHLGVVLRNEVGTNPIPRSSVQGVYSSIESDLNFAITNLGEPLLKDSSEYIRGYASKESAQALLAKVYFTQGRYDEAVPLLDEVIAVFGGTLPTDLDRFLQDASSPESIFELVSTQARKKSDRLKDHYRSDIEGIPTFTASSELYQIVNLDPDDLRSDWVNVENEGELEEYFPFTRFNKEYFNVPVLHLTDMFLMRAEALARSGGDLGQAKSDLDQIRQRAGLDPTSSGITTNPALVIEEALAQRRIEMMCEGDWIFHLKRLGAIHDQPIVVRDVDWYCNGMVLQFPNSEGTVSTFEFNPSSATCQ